MARQNVGFAELLCVALPPSGTYSVSFRFYAIARLDYLLSFRFFFWKIYAKRSGANHNGNGKREKRGANNIFSNIKILALWHTTSISTSKQDVIHSSAFSKKRGTVWGKS
jgi:hypothetical protein